MWQMRLLGGSVPTSKRRKRGGTCAYSLASETGVDSRALPSFLRFKGHPRPPGQIERPGSTARFALSNSPEGFGSGDGLILIP